MGLGPLAGRTAIVTGGGRGLGEAYVRALADEGAHVVVADIRHDDASSLRQELGEAVTLHLHDVTSVRSWQILADEVLKRLPPVAVLINNAGVHAFGSVTDVSPETWSRVLDVNVTGAFLGIRAVAPLMAEGAGGTIINVSSTCGVTGYADQAAYVASKWAVRGLSKAAAMDLAPMNIRVHCLVPGPFATPMTKPFEADLANLAATQPIPRVGLPFEAGRLVRFLCVDASYSTGSEFFIDGGAMAGISAISNE